MYDHAGGTTIAATAWGDLLPYEFHREITVDAHAPIVRLRYRLTHQGDAPFPWIWSAHPLFAVQPGTLLELPTVSQVKLDAVHGRDDLARDAVVRWPDADAHAGRGADVVGGSSIVRGLSASYGSHSPRSLCGHSSVRKGAAGRPA